MLSPAPTFRRRAVLKGLGAAALAPTLAAPASAVRPAPIRLSVVSRPGRGKFYRAGAARAVEEMSQAGGIRGRPILIDYVAFAERRAPDGQHPIRDYDDECRTLRTAVGLAPHAILSEYTCESRACFDVLSTCRGPYFTTHYGGPGHDLALDLYHGRIVFGQAFEVGSAAIYRPANLPLGLDALAKGYGWGPGQRKIHIISESGPSEVQVTDNIAGRAQAGSFEWTTITHLTDSAHDWTPVLQVIAADGPAVVFLDYRLTADSVGLPRFAPDRRRGPIVYLQYAPICQMPGEYPWRIFNDGFVWATLHGIYNDSCRDGQGTDEFWRANRTIISPHDKIYNDSAKSYAATRLLGAAWQHVEPEDFAAVIDYAQAHANLSTSLRDNHDSWRGRIY